MGYRRAAGKKNRDISGRQKAKGLNEGQTQTEGQESQQKIEADGAEEKVILPGRVPVMLRGLHWQVWGA